MLKKWNFAVILSLKHKWVVKRFQFGSYFMINCAETDDDIFRNFWFLNSYRLTLYLNLTGVSHWSPQFLSVISLASGMYQKRGKCHKHCKTIHTWGSWFRNWWNNISNLQLEIPVVYYSWTRAWEIVCIVYHKPIYSNLALLNANIFLCTPKKFKASAFMYAFFSIAYCFLSAECPLFSLIDLFWFYCFAKLIE